MGAHDYAHALAAPRPPRRPNAPAPSAAPAFSRPLGGGSSRAAFMPRARRTSAARRGSAWPTSTSTSPPRRISCSPWWRTTSSPNLAFFADLFEGRRLPRPGGGGAGRPRRRGGASAVRWGCEPRSSPKAPSATSASAWRFARSEARLIAALDGGRPRRRRTAARSVLRDGLCGPRTVGRPALLVSSRPTGVIGQRAGSNLLDRLLERAGRVRTPCSAAPSSPRAQPDLI